MRKRLLVTLASAAMVVGLMGPAAASAATDVSNGKSRTPSAATSGKQAKPSLAPNSSHYNAKRTTPLGATKSTSRKVVAVTPKVGYDSTVDFTGFYNYCWHNFVYTPVHNYSGVTKYFYVSVYGDGGVKTFYSSVAAGATAYPYFYDMPGSYTAYLYVWNGSSYAYDEYSSNANNCNVSVSVASSPYYSGYVLMTIKNSGNAYATVNSQELAPYNTYGTYTGGMHYDYPALNGGVIYRYYYVGTGVRYGIVADVDGSYSNSWGFSGVY